MITNFVTVTDVVNAVLSVHGAAICANDPQETAEITARADALLINMGTPNDRMVESALISGARANESGIPVVLDPAGAGASRYRISKTRRLLSNIHFSCIKCNRSEALQIYNIVNDIDETAPNRGVESSDDFSEEKWLTNSQIRQLSDDLNTVLVITGETDIVAGEKDDSQICKDIHSDGKVYKEGDLLFSNLGSQWQTMITGSGCMLAGIIAAALGSGHRSAADALIDYELAAERAVKNMTENGIPGTGSFHMYLMNELCRVNYEF